LAIGIPERAICSTFVFTPRAVDIARPDISIFRAMRLARFAQGHLQRTTGCPLQRRKNCKATASFTGAPRFARALLPSGTPVYGTACNFYKISLWEWALIISARPIRLARTRAATGFRRPMRERSIS
jgi:hypothetical protein